MSEDAPDELNQPLTPSREPAREPVAIPVTVAGEPSPEARSTNVQYVNLAPEHHINPNAKKAEVSQDSRFNTMNPKAAGYIVGEKIYHSSAQKYLFEGVEPLDQKVTAEHQRQDGWTQDRSGKTESGADVHVRRGDVKSYVLETDPNMPPKPGEWLVPELYEHREGIEIGVTYEPTPGQRRVVEWFIPVALESRVLAEDTVPEHITIFDSTADEPLVLTRWSTEGRGGKDPRFDKAIQEIGILLGERISWYPPSKSTEFEDQAQQGIDEIPVTPIPPPHES